MTDNFPATELEIDPINLMGAFYLCKPDYGSFSVIQNEHSEALLFLTENAAQDFCAANALTDYFAQPVTIGNIRQFMPAYLVREDLHLEQI